MILVALCITLLHGHELLSLTEATGLKVIIISKESRRTNEVRNSPINAQRN